MGEPERITIEIPDFAGMTDDEVSVHPLSRHLDGRWSPLTRHLMQALGTDKLDLNEAWAGTWYRWECPACGREKVDIARVTEDGVLLCKLSNHHDHIHDIAKKMFRAAGELPSDRDSRAARVRARLGAYALIRRFEDTLVCEDCNNADTDMKAALGDDVDRFFSFSPAEIGAFVLPAPNRPHEIDIDAGRAVYAVAKPAFEDRMAFARMLIDRVERGLNDIEVSGPLWAVPAGNDRMLYRLALERAGPRSRLDKMFEGLSNRSRASDGNQSNRRKRSRRRIAVPTQEDFAQVCARNADSRPWVSAGDDWRCPICERSKFEICRKSNSGAWTAQIHHLIDFEPEADAENMLWRSRDHLGPIMLGGQRSYSLCQDCRHIVVEAIKLVPGADTNCLRPGDIGTVIGDPLPHQMHAVSPEAIREAVAENSDWIEAVADFLVHRRVATGLVTDIRILTRDGFDDRTARRRVFDAFLNGRPETGSEIDHFKWLLREGRRLTD